ncbi:Hypothetical predicted protein [Scomber scombrus]|uniref:Uncharacterized protein n=1 Tax=Scomber scombrus TaxID=13677 RepID=A0AAV1PSQ9_SCOSC
MSTELWCIIWIFNVYLKQDSWDRQTRRLEPAGEGFGAIRPYTQRTPSLFTLHQAELNSCAAEPAAGWNTAEGYRCVRTSERKRLILQPLSLAKTEGDRHGSLRTDRSVPQLPCLLQHKHIRPPWTAKTPQDNEKKQT